MSEHTQAHVTLPDGHDEEPTLEYYNLLRAARDVDFTDVQTMDIVRPSGVDREGRPMVLLIGNHYDPSKVDLEKVYQFFCLTMDEVAGDEYTLVYFHTRVGWSNRPSLWWLFKTYGRLPRKYKKNIAYLAIVHPSIGIRSFFWTLRPVLSSKFWEKLVFADRCEELWLDDVIERGSIVFPPECDEYEREQNEKAKDAALVLRMMTSMPEAQATTEQTATTRNTATRHTQS